MTTHENETTTAGSERVPQRRSEGIAGPSREVSQRDHEPSGAGGAGRENEELEWGRQHVPDDHSTDPPEARRIRSVFRKTELNGINPASTPDGKKRVRKRTMQNLNAPGGIVAYVPFEAAFRDFICSLMERQDQNAEEMFLQCADLRQRLDALEDRLERDRAAQAGAPGAGP
jgi:hypothetical protein